MEELEEVEAKGFLPNLGKGLGSVVQTRDGGYLAAMNRFETEVLRKEMPRIAMQISKPLILPLENSASGFEVFQKIAPMGVEELASKVLSATGERISTGIWNVREEPMTLEEVLAFSLQKTEVMAVEALKIQAEIAEEEAPFDVSPLLGKTGGKDADRLLASAVSLEEWVKNGGLASKDEPRTLTLLVVVQLRDPLRRYEAVGSPVIALIQATCVDAANVQEEERYKVASFHIGGLKVRAGGKRNAWDAEKQRPTAMQWLLAYGSRKAAKKGKNM
ncbi:hypothetical protein MRB53_027396 [Persea americana]|uniref:Uncharacterized protein n=1 Tax=Persea americana TaxID=3435 RepID=A0ACC2LL06_PERAE|nr:hypothetical protein MRB53_027396 [Persea americana]